MRMKNRKFEVGCLRRTQMKMMLEKQRNYDVLNVRKVGLLRMMESDGVNRVD
jgi:hypothetical protein